MTMKQLFIGTFSFLFALTVAGSAIAVTRVAAATLTLQNIGVSSVGGRRISSWTYMGSNPTFSGTADPSAQVTVTIADAAGTATADASGAWSYKPTTLTAEGTYPVVITSGDQTLQFTLGISPYSGAATGTASAGASKGGVTPEELPVSGSVGETLKLIALGLGLIAMGGVSWWLSKELQPANSSSK